MTQETLERRWGSRVAKEKPEQKSDTERHMT